MFACKNVHECKNRGFVFSVSMPYCCRKLNGWVTTVGKHMISG